MRYANRRDNSHKPIAAGLLAAGFSVMDTSRLGGDFPDLIAGKYGIDMKVECKTMDVRKNGHKTASELLSEGQKDFKSSWKGTPVVVAYSLQDALHGFEMLKKRLGWVK
jgi:Holliday junction resolvase